MRGGFVYIEVLGESCEVDSSMNRREADPEATQLCTWHTFERLYLTDNVPASTLQTLSSNDASFTINQSCELLNCMVKRIEGLLPGDEGYNHVAV